MQDSILCPQSLRDAPKAGSFVPNSQWRSFRALLVTSQTPAIEIQPEGTTTSWLEGQSPDPKHNRCAWRP